eukprot:Em0014g430a
MDSILSCDTPWALMVLNRESSRGDPLGPLLFSLVLHKLVHSIASDSPKGSVKHATRIIQQVGNLEGFPADMKMLHEPNLEILGAPIGDDIFCAKFVAQKWAKATKWLSQIAHPAFTSTTAAVELGKRGLFLQGIVKDATKEYPAKYLDTFQYEKGDHHVVTSTIDGIPMLALGWQDRTLKKFLAMCGTTVEGHPHKKKTIYHVLNDGKSSEAFFKTVKRPKLVEEYFDSAGKIDIHNHLRQGSLALEEGWGMKKWHHRVISTILGMVEVDTFLVY